MDKIDLELLKAHLEVQFSIPDQDMSLDDKLAWHLLRLHDNNYIPSLSDWIILFEALLDTRKRIAELESTTDQRVREIIAKRESELRPHRHKK